MCLDGKWSHLDRFLLSNRIMKKMKMFKLGRKILLKSFRNLSTDDFLISSRKAKDTSQIYSIVKKDHEEMIQISVSEDFFGGKI